MIISNILNLEFIVVNEIYHMAVLLTFLHLVGNNPAKANYFSLNIEKLITFLHLVGNNPAKANYFSLNIEKLTEVVQIRAKFSHFSQIHINKIR